MNKRKGFLYKTLWFKHQQEFNNLIDCLNNGEKNEVYNIILAIHKRGDL